MSAIVRLLTIQVFVCIAIGALQPIYAQRPINGNGNAIEQVRPLSQFKSVSLDFTAELVIVNGETPSFHITGEDNILSNIGTRVRGGVLYISQDRWIEPTQMVKIRVGTPFISELTTSGYSTVVVENVKGPRVKLNIGVGKVSLQGNTDRLMIRTKTGTIDASQLNTEYVDVAISSHGKVELGNVSELVANVSKRSMVVYAGDPVIRYKNDNSIEALVHIDDYEVPDSAAIQYIALSLVNNSRQRINLRVEGPINRDFSYGFSMDAADIRREDWPVGTRLYSENGILSDKLLLTVTAEMHSKQVELFSKE